MTGPGRNIALLGSESHVLACRAEQVEAIMEQPRVFPLPGMPQGFDGVCLFRDEPVPVIARERLPVVLPTDSSCLAICKSEMGLIGIPVISGGRFVQPEEGQFETCTGASLPGFAECFVFQGESYPFLDIEQLLLMLQP